MTSLRKILLVPALGVSLSIPHGATPAHAGKAGRALMFGLAAGATIYALSQMAKKHRKHGKKHARRGGIPRSKVRAIQAALNERGFGAGKPDGLMGRGTHAAIRRYQSAIGARATGVLTKAQIAELTGGKLKYRTDGARLSGYAGHCSHPIADENFPAVNKVFKEIISDDDPSSYSYGNIPTYTLDKCGYITVRSGNDITRGHILDLVTEANFSDHKYAYIEFITFGVPDEGSSGSFDGITYKTKNLFSVVTSGASESAQWMTRTFKKIRRMHELAGYKHVPYLKEKVRYVQSELETFQRPDLAETFAPFLALARKGQAPAPAIDYNSSEYASAKNHENNYICQFKCIKTYAVSVLEHRRSEGFVNVKVKAANAQSAENIVKPRILDMCKSRGYDRSAEGMFSYLYCKITY